MNRSIPAEIEELFARYPALTGFSVRSVKDVPDNCPRVGGEESELFVADIGILPMHTFEQYGEIFEDITTTLAELLDEGAEEELKGRTFARTIH